MYNKSKLNMIREFIAKSDLDSAMMTLQKMEIKDAYEIQKAILMTSSNYSNLRNSNISNLISYEEYVRGRQKITSAIIEIISDINNLADSPNSLSRKTSIKKDPFSRTDRVAMAAKELFNENQLGIIRQKAPFSVFAIPNRLPSEPIWKKRDGGSRSEEYKLRQYNERFWIGRHMEASYCKLIIKPDIIENIKKTRGVNQAYYRLRILYDFIQSNIEKVDVVMVENLERPNILILGNWFYSSYDKHTGQTRNPTIFNWEKDMVENQVKIFDNEFEEILISKNKDVYEAKEEVLIYLKSKLEEIKREKDVV